MLFDCVLAYYDAPCVTISGLKCAVCYNGILFCCLYLCLLNDFFKPKYS